MTPRQENVVAFLFVMFMLLSITFAIGTLIQLWWWL